MRVRPEEPDDRGAVFDVIARAFGRRAEAELVERLREAGDSAIALVAEAGGRVVGHVLFSPVEVRSGGVPWRALGLAPLAVAPEWQRRGVGSALVRAGLEACRGDRHPVVFVLGNPDYYASRGFRPAAPFGLRYEAAGHEAAFFVAELEPGAVAGRTGVVHYAPAFGATLAPEA